MPERRGCRFCGQRRVSIFVLCTSSVVGDNKPSIGVNMSLVLAAQYCRNCPACASLCRIEISGCRQARQRLRSPLQRCCSDHWQHRGFPPSTLEPQPTLKSWNPPIKPVAFNVAPGWYKKDAAPACDGRSAQLKCCRRRCCCCCSCELRE